MTWRVSVHCSPISRTLCVVVFFFFLFNIAGRCSGYKELGKGCDSRPVWSFRGDLDIAHIPAGRWRVFFGGRDGIWSGVRGILWLGASGVSGRQKS